VKADMSAIVGRRTVDERAAGLAADRHCNPLLLPLPPGPGRPARQATQLAL